MSSAQDITNLHNKITKEILPRSHQVHTHYKQFVNLEIKNFQTINHQNDRVLDQLKKEWNHFNKIVNDFKVKDNRDKKFIEGSDLYLKAKEDQIAGKGKVLESFNSGIKETVSKIKPEKLALLPLDKEPKLITPFQTLFSILYRKPKETFVWKQFEAKGLELDNGEDFITRLANINFKDLTTYEYDQLRKLKNDQEFKDIAENSIYAIDIVDLADWVDYVVEGHKLSLEKRHTELEFEKIRNDKSKRSDGSLKHRIEFCTQTLAEYDSYQNNLMSLESEIRTLIFSFKNDLTGIDEISSKRNDKIKEINSL